MKNILNIDNGIPTLLSNVDDGTNTLYINDELVPSSEWTGTGYYTFTSGGLTFTIQKIRDDSGNIMLQLIEQSGGTSYRLIKAISNDEKYYSIDDPAETDLADGDYMPFYDTSAGRKKKTLWSNIVDKIKAAIWKRNTNAQEGYVTSGAGKLFCAWNTDAAGNPEWVANTIMLPTITYSQLPSQSTETPIYFREWLVYMAANYTNRLNSARPLMAVVRPNSTGVVLGHCYSGDDVDPTTKLPRYCSFIYNSLDKKPFVFGTVNFEYYFDTVDHDTKYDFYGGTFNSGGANVSEHNANSIVNNGHYYYDTNGPATSIGAKSADGALYAQSYNAGWVGQIAQDYRNGHLFVRARSNGTWTSWESVCPNVAYIWYKDYKRSVTTITNSYVEIVSVQLTLEAGKYMVFGTCPVRCTNGTAYLRITFNSVEAGSAHASFTSAGSITIIGIITVTAQTTAWLKLDGVDSNGTAYIDPYHTICLAGIKTA